MARSRRPTPSRAAPPGAPGAPAPGSPSDPGHPAPPARRFDRLAWAALAAYAVALGWTQIVGHRTPLYDVETDLFTDFIPAARNLLAGALSTEHYQFKGFGYPLLLAGGTLLAGGDAYLAARLLNVAAAVAGGAFAYLLFRRFLGARGAFFVLLGLLASPVYLRAAIEAGTDAPSFALAIAATAPTLFARTPRALAAAGLLAGFAVVTRYNAAFLVAAALPALLARERRTRALIAYAAGLAAPVGAWLIANHALTGDALNTRNYANVAYEVYGRGASWDEFAAHTLPRFQSLGDVVRYDPGRFAARIGANLAGRWLRDARELLPPWLGLLAVPGMALCWRGRRRARDVAIHFAACYAVLALVFYAPRFSLYLIPFYLAGAVALVVESRLPARAAAVLPAALRARLGPLRAGLMSVLILASGVRAVAEARATLARAPHEVREAGLLLRSLGGPGARVMARKPHVAHFAGMDFVAMPLVYTVPELVRAGREAGARYLFFSPIEAALRPQFMALADSGVALPGLAPVAHRALDGARFFVLYELTGEPADPAATRDSLLAAAARAAARRPGEAWPQWTLAGHLMEAGRHAEALRALARAEALEPANPMVARMQSVALYHLGAHDEAARACERAIALGADTAWERAHLGHIRLAQGRHAEARAELERAVALEPARTEYVLGLGMALLHSGAPAAAAREFEKALAASPEDARARWFAARAWLLGGDPGRALATLDAAPRPVPELAALADSIRAAAGSR